MEIQETKEGKSFKAFLIRRRRVFSPAISFFARAFFKGESSDWLGDRLRGRLQALDFASINDFR